ncbi:hypothetical protein AR456_04910 [Halomonas huangheensis]|nr:hypothetical protein AR456_04910 [Halomonas huangheensis]
MDLTGFFTSDNDARSRTFRFGSANAHDFTVDTAGTYRFGSSVTAGYDENYSIEAVLLDDRGNVIARDKGYGLEGGLELDQQLEPGDYVLQVKAMRFGSSGRAGDGYSVSVAGLDAQGNPLSDSVDDGVGLHFTGEDREGNQSVFVSGDVETVTLGAGNSGAAAAASTAGTANSAAASSAGAVAGSSSTAASTAGTAAAGAAAVGATAAVSNASEAASGADSSASASSGDPEVQVIKTDVKIRARGEALSFNVAQQGRVHITTSTYPAGDEDSYRLSLKVLDESGSVVAEGAGEGFNGNVDLTTDLAPGSYRIDVAGQKFGSSHDGPNNYELKVELED